MNQTKKERINPNKAAPLLMKLATFDGESSLSSLSLLPSKRSAREKCVATLMQAHHELLLCLSEESSKSYFIDIFEESGKQQRPNKFW